VDVFTEYLCDVLAQPVRRRRRRLYDAVRRAVTSVAKESATKIKNCDGGQCFRPRSSSPCPVDAFCCSTTPSRDKHGQSPTTSKVLSAVSSRVQHATLKNDRRHLRRDCHRNDRTSLSQTRCDVTRSTHLDNET